MATVLTRCSTQESSLLTASCNQIGKVICTIPFVILVFLRLFFSENLLWFLASNFFNYEQAQLPLQRCDRLLGPF